MDWLWPHEQTTTFGIKSPQGVYNTEINVYALYRCLDKTDHYAVTAQADWTATQRQMARGHIRSPNPSMYLDQQQPGNQLARQQDLLLIPRRLSRFR